MAEFKAFSPTAWRAFQNKCAALFPFLKKTFTGTTAEWEALTTTEQNNYDIVNITDDESNTGDDGELSLTTSSGTVTKQLYSQRGGTLFIRINITLTTEIAAGGVFYCSYALPVQLVAGFGMPLHGVAEQTSSIGDVPVTGYASQTQLYIATSVSLPIGTVVQFFGEAPIAM